MTSAPMRAFGQSIYFGQTLLLIHTLVTAQGLDSEVSGTAGCWSAASVLQRSITTGCKVAGDNPHGWLISSVCLHLNPALFALSVAFCAVLGASEPSSLAEQLSQAQQLEDKMDFEGATRILLGAVRLAEVGGEKESSLAIMLNNLGITMQDHGRYLDAERLYRASIRIWELSYGDNYAGASNPLNNLASLYFRRGEPKRSAALRLRALTIRTAALGTHHPAVARLRANLAADLFAQRKYEEAEILCREALANLSASLDRALALNTLALVRGEANDFVEALKFVDEALDILDRIEPQDTLRVADCLRAKAGFLHATGRNGSAEATLQRSLALLESAPLVDRSLYVAALRQYAAVLKDQGRRAEARIFERRATAMYRDLEREYLIQPSVSFDALAAQKK